MRHIWLFLLFPCPPCVRQAKIHHYSHRAFMANTGIGSKILFCLTYVLHLLWVQEDEPPAGVDCMATLHPVTIDVCSASAAHPVPCPWLPASRETFHSIPSLFPLFIQITGTCCMPSSLKQLLVLSKGIQWLTLSDACHSCRVPSTNHFHIYTAHSWYLCPCLRLASAVSVWIYFQCLCPEPSHLRPPHKSQCHILAYDLPPS